MVQTPGANPVMTPADVIEQMPGSELTETVKVTGLPEAPPVAVSVPVLPTLTVGGVPKVMI